jgi:hypothetical protein
MSFHHGLIQFSFSFNQPRALSTQALHHSIEKLRGIIFVSVRSGDITPELTRTEHRAFNLREQDNHESHAIKASG